MADVVTVPSHLAVPEVRTYMTAKAAADLSDPAPSAPTAVDERGRSAQTFVVDVLVRAGGQERRVVAAGQDIYAISAPLAVEAVDRILTGRTRTTGVASAGAAFDVPTSSAPCPRTSRYMSHSTHTAELPSSIRAPPRSPSPAPLTPHTKNILLAI